MIAIIWNGVRDFVSICLLVGLISFISAPARAGAEIAPTTFDYGPHKLDVYTSPTANPTRRGAPVMVYLHGGGWFMGNRRHLHSKVKFFTDAGYVLVSVGYRLFPRARILDQVSDVSRSLTWVRQNIRKFGGNPRNIHLMGHSAGAHLAALAITRGDAGPIRSAIINDTKVLDILAYVKTQKFGELPAVYREVFAPKDKWATYSPATYLHQAKRLPPMLLAWSGRPTRKRRALTEQFAGKVRNVGGKVTVFDGSQYWHLPINSRIGRKGDSFTATITSFLNRHNR